MSLGLRISIFSFFCFLNSFTYTWAYVRQLGLPIVPAFDLSSLFFIYSETIPLLHAFAIVTAFTFVVVYFYDEDKAGYLASLSQPVRLLLSLFLSVVIVVVSYFFDSKAYNTFFMLSLFVSFSLLLFSNNVIPYSNDKLIREVSFLPYLVLIVCLSLFYFNDLGANRIHSSDFEKIVALNKHGESFELVPLWTYKEYVYGVECPENVNTLVPSEIRKYKDGNLIYKLNHISRGRVQRLCGR